MPGTVLGLGVWIGIHHPPQERPLVEEVNNPVGVSDSKACIKLSQGVSEAWSAGQAKLASFHCMHTVC